jgi:hypothetical protein
MAPLSRSPAGAARAFRAGRRMIGEVIKDLSKVAEAPPWLLRALTPFVARRIARQMALENPGVPARALAARMRADLGAQPNPDALRLVRAVERRLAAQPPNVTATASAPAAPPWLSAAVLVAANLVPLYGVAMLGWPVFAVLLLFWVENVIVGLLNVARMLCADPADPAQWLLKLFFVPFFCFHYGMFTAVHGTFVFGFFGKVKATGSGEGMFPIGSWLAAIGEQGLWLAVAVLAVSHLFSFFWNYLGHGEFRLASVAELMGKPYGRVVVLHLTILFGGFGVQALGAPVWALLLLVGLKTGIDLFAHLKEHLAVPKTTAGAGGKVLEQK